MTAFWAAFQASRSFKTTNGPSPKREKELQAETRVSGPMAEASYASTVLPPRNFSTPRDFLSSSSPKSRYTVIDVF